MTPADAIAHGVVTLAAIIGYVVLTVLGHDGSILLGIPVGQGAAVATVAASSSSSARRRP